MQIDIDERKDIYGKKVIDSFANDDDYMNAKVNIRNTSSMHWILFSTKEKIIFHRNNNYEIIYSKLIKL